MEQVGAWDSGVNGPQACWATPPVRGPLPGAGGGPDVEGALALSEWQGPQRPPRLVLDRCSTQMRATPSCSSHIQLFPHHMHPLSSSRCTSGVMLCGYREQKLQQPRGAAQGAVAPVSLLDFP